MKSDLESKSSSQPESNLKLHGQVCQYKSKLLKQIPIPKIELKYHLEIPPDKRLKILHSKHAASILRSLWNRDTFELQESFGVLFLNNSNQIIGLYPQSDGGITSTLVDIRLILTAALNCGAVGMVACHNYPSGNKKPSISDRELTQKLEKAGKLIDIKLLDHIILTKEDYYSFADQGEIDF